jgi:hypothetical protein
MNALTRSILLRLLTLWFVVGGLPSLVQAQLPPPKPNVQLTLTAPQPGARFATGQTIPLTASAVSDGEGVYALDFLADGERLGTSQIFTLVAIPPGQPIQHEWLWDNAKPGIHVLTVAYHSALGSVTVSEPVRIIVGEDPAVPSLTWNNPVEGEILRTPGVPVLTVTTFDPLSEIRRVEFFDGADRIGVSEILTRDAIFPGRPRVLSLGWTNPPPGFHTLVAVAVAADGTALKAPVRVQVEAEGVPGETVVTVVAGKGQAFETGDLKNRTLNFEISRTGDLNRELLVFTQLSGTATPEVDYVRPGDGQEPLGSAGKWVIVRMGQGVRTAALPLEAVPDKAIEGRETVILTVVESPLAGPLGYRIGKPASAEGVIEELPTRLAHIDWVNPVTGDTFAVGQAIELAVEAQDPAGLLTHVDFYAGDRRIGFSDWSCPECRMASGATLPHQFVWKGAEPGRHTLWAEGVDAAGIRVVSALVTVVVKDGPAPVGVAVRRLPAGYTPGQPFEVVLEIKPAPGTQNYVVEDRPPYVRVGGAAPPPGFPHWSVTAIRQDGLFEPTTGTVKFGPFLGSEPRVLTYQVTPDDGWAEQPEFGGDYVADGRRSAIQGDTLLHGARRHPADIAPADDAIRAEELTAYGAAWRRGELWRNEPIPMNYVTRAGTLWREGEHYRFDAAAGPAPFWWVSNPLLPPAAPGKPAGSPAIVSEGQPRFGGLAHVTTRPGQEENPAVIEVRLLPAPGGVTSAVELKLERVPTGITEGGVYDPAQRVVRWGPFPDGLPHTVQVRIPGGSVGAFAGRASFDGTLVPVLPLLSGSEATGEPKLVGVQPTADGAMQLVMEPAGGVSGAGYRLEVSTDLVHWTPLGDFQPGAAAAAFARDELAASDVPRFYRAVGK